VNILYKLVYSFQVPPFQSKIVSVSPTLPGVPIALASLSFGSPFHTNAPSVPGFRAVPSPHTDLLYSIFAEELSTIHIFLGSMVSLSSTL
jgi:hypothetical protein